MSAGLWFAVAGLGAIGALARFLGSEWIDHRAQRPFPIGIMLVNLSGAFVLGLLVGLGLPTTAETLAGTATVGAYTTFSTWVVESDAMLERRRWRAGAANLTISLFVGFGAALAGRALGLALS